MAPFTDIQQWYETQCNGDWEHSYGIKISTLDNPGWKLAIELWDTDFEIKQFEEIAIERSDLNWLRCWKDDGVFHGCGGPHNLNEILTVFLSWANNQISLL